MAETLRPRILIVESYGSNAKSILSHLAASPIPLHVVSVGDAEAAITLTQNEDFDLAIIDTCLRGKMDGFDLCRALRSSEATQRLPVILLLAGYLFLERARGISAGADLLLHRPVVKGELLRMIQLLLAEKLAQAATIQPAAENHTERRLRSVS
ncbi:MAG TPA: response regulator [Candidatus Binatia bacterium]|jgi:DNA-binding response OmpR family regulator|nr:response regulator [Candidatus Binatia bacterium]